MRSLLDSIHAFLGGIPYRWLFLLVFSFLLGLFLTLVVRRIACKFKILDHPQERKIHAAPIPLLGGLAIYISYVATIFLNFSFSAELKGVVLGGTVILIVGLIDDIRELSAVWKLMAQVLATSILIFYGVRLSFLPNNWWGITGEVILTLIWVVGITNAVNFFDGMDGLATGAIAIGSISFFIVAMMTGQAYLSYLTIALAGSCLAFLIFNFKPASIFLGDAGSTFLGFTVAGIAVMGGWAQDNPKVALSLPILILSVFIFDMIYITISRIYRGRVRNFREWLEYAGKDHLHHRLVALGLTETQAVLLIYLIAACLGIGGIHLRANGNLVIFLEILQGALIFAIIVILMRTGQKLAKK
ncbi:MAG: undecaprenyl/decaprenyl-phosphate alpha-N-acetylglucosaminyl 1-phosphate transferase [Candidatus Aminicenantes bacterium]|nr:undecaprenyl/decaprenyl-phosphate alpha-N-acetylglucosaminyl 1-phosphate transferase [Candidatus Aminicenantes bacterium]MDH5704737.1 undecaprenyl/decaprenyl-phosphate alpha-N-acetylglucosaminyl 1-phosphate transferase [Candidatus Aminicenantes bacterium]